MTPERVVIKDRGTPRRVVGPSDQPQRVVTADGLVGPPGSQGATGAAGPTGAPGADGLNTPYRHVQGSPASVWTIAHNTGFHLNWRVVDSAGNPAVAHPVDLDSNTTQISFFAAGAPVAFAGEAYGS